MLQFLDFNLDKNLRSECFKDLEKDFLIHRREYEEGLREWFIYRKQIKLLDGEFMIDFHFLNGFLTHFGLQALGDFYGDNDEYHRKWLYTNYGGKEVLKKNGELHFITDEYDFYNNYDPRSGDANIDCRPL